MDTTGIERPFPNRPAQLAMLQRLSADYPDLVDVQRWEDEYPAAQKNLYYLRENGLIKALMPGSLEAPNQIAFAAINNEGVDFLNGGGLSSELAVVTIKLHDESLEAVRQWVQKSNLAPADKQRFADRLRSLPADATKHLVMKLIDAGLANAPAALNAIQSALS